MKGVGEKLKGVLSNIFSTVLLSPSGVNASGLSDNWFWRVGLFVRRFFYLVTSLKGSSLERFSMLSNYYLFILFFFIFFSPQSNLMTINSLKV